MTDSPTRKKRFGAGMCWEYMERGACPCATTARFPAWHPKLSLATTTTTAATTGSPGAIAVTVASMPKRVPEWIEGLKCEGFAEGDPDNFAVLDATYEEREEVKALGASFSPGMKRWIVVRGRDLGPFARWRPRIRNRAANEVVLHAPRIDIASTVRALRRRGLHSSHFDIRGSGGGEVTREELSTTLRLGSLDSDAGKQKTQPCVIDIHSGGAGAKRRLDLNERSTTSAGVCDHASGTKRPCFSTPESLKTFVRRKQDEQRGCTGEQLGELSAFLATAKTALVRCNRDGGISQEQKHFNETIYNLAEALVAKMKSSEEIFSKMSVVSAAEMSPACANPRQNMVTPTQKTRAHGKASGVPGTWYEATRP